MENDENNPQQTVQTSLATHYNTQIKETNTAPQRPQDGTNLKEYSNLMPKTIEELKEIQARGRRLMFKKKYIKRNRLGPAQARQKTEEELKLEAIQREKDIKEFAPQIVYSKYYTDDEHEYRHVVLPKNLAKWLPKGLLKPEQWIALGVHQSSGWEHYMIYAPEPHILLFKREKGYIAKYGDHAPQVPPEMIDETKRQRRQKEGRKQQQGQPTAMRTSETTVSSIPPSTTGTTTVQNPSRPRTRSTTLLASNNNNTIDRK